VRARLGYLIALACCSGNAAAPPTDVIATTVKVGNVSYTFRSTVIGNLTHQLDCLAELIPCSPAAYASVWPLSIADKHALATWKELRSHYSGTIEDGSQPADPPPFPLARKARRVDAALRVAGYGARDVDEYLARLALFASGADVDRARGVIEQFRDRAYAQWRAHRAELLVAANEYAVLAGRADIDQLVSSIATFYRVERPAGSRQVFELVWRPSHDSPTYAQYLGSLAVLDVTTDEPPKRQYPVILHELFHGWFDASPIEQQFDLAVRFAQSTDSFAGPGYGLLDETLATTLGNGLVQRLVEPAEYARLAAKPLGLYYDAPIDASAKALLPHLETWIGQGKSIYDKAFVAMYLGAIHEAFPHGLPVVAHMRPLAGVTQEDLPRASDHLTQACGAGVVQLSSDPDEAREILATTKEWGTAILLTHAGIAKLDGRDEIVDASLLAELRKQTEPSFVLVVPRESLGTVFVFVANDDATMIELIDAFIARGEVRAGPWVPS